MASNSSDNLPGTTVNYATSINDWINRDTVLDRVFPLNRRQRAGSIAAQRIYHEITQIADSQPELFERIVADLRSLRLPESRNIGATDHVITTVRINMNMYISAMGMQDLMRLTTIYFELLSLMLEPYGNDNRRGAQLFTDMGAEDRRRGIASEDREGSIAVVYSPDSLEKLRDKIRQIGDKYDEDDVFVATALEVAVLRIPEMYARGSLTGPRTEEQASTKWVAVDTQTTYNCFWVALATSLNWNRSNSKLLKDAAVRIKAGGDLKRKCGVGRLRGTGPVEYQIAANYCKRPIQFYNSLFQMQDDGLYLPQISGVYNTKPVNIVISNNHARSLIPREEIQEACRSGVIPNMELPGIGATVVREIGIVQKRQKRARTSAMGQQTFYELSNGNYGVGVATFPTEEDARQYIQDNEFQLKENDDITEPILLDKDKLIQRIETRPTKLAAADLETCGKESDKTAIHKSYAMGIAWFDSNGTKRYKDFWGYGTAVKSCMKWLYDNRTSFDEYTIVFHNGSRFDVIIMLNEFLFTDHHCWKIVDMLEAGGKIISLSLESRSTIKCRIKVHDTSLISPASLDTLTGVYNVEHKKLTGTVKHHQIVDSNWHYFQPKVEPYLRNDCLGLLEVYDAMAEALYEDSEMDITKYVTGASIAINTMYKRWYNKDVYPMYSLPKSYDDYIRETGYLGGRTEAFYIGKARPGMVNYYDVNSMYPWAGTQDLPYGKPIIYNAEEFNRRFVRRGVLQRNFFGFVKVKITSTNLDYNFAEMSESDDIDVLKERFVQLHGVKYATSSDVKRLIFPKFIECKIPITEFCETIFYSQEEGFPYVYEFVGGIEFQKGPCRADYYNHHYNKRVQVKKTKPAIAEKLKLMLNSTYGRESMNTHGKDSVKLYPANAPDYHVAYKSNNLINISMKGEYCLVRKRCDMNGKDINIGIGAAITAWSRIKIHKCIMSIIRKGGHVLYCDTDSVIALIKAEGTSLWDDWNGTDIDGKLLGSMKNEFDEKFEKACKSVRCTEEEERITGEKFRSCTDEEKQAALDVISTEGKGFNEVIIAGAKMYFLQRRLTDKINVTTHAFKGLSKKAYNLTLEDFEKLRSGDIFNPFEEEDEDTEMDRAHQMEEITIDYNGAPTQIRVPKPQIGQTSFVSGKRSIMTDTSDDGGVRVLYVRKQFRMLYSKGTYEGADHYVNALEITYGENKQGTKRKREIEQEEDDESQSSFSVEYE